MAIPKLKPYLSEENLGIFRNINIFKVPLFVYNNYNNNVPTTDDLSAKKKRFKSGAPHPKQKPYNIVSLRKFLSLQLL